MEEIIVKNFIVRLIISAILIIFTTANAGINEIKPQKVKSFRVFSYKLGFDFKIDIFENREISIEDLFEAKGNYDIKIFSSEYDENGILKSIKVTFKSKKQTLNSIPVELCLKNRDNLITWKENGKSAEYYVIEI